MYSLSDKVTPAVIMSVLKNPLIYIILLVILSHSYLSCCAVGLHLFWFNFIAIC